VTTKLDAVKLVVWLILNHLTHWQDLGTDDQFLDEGGYIHFPSLVALQTTKSRYLAKFRVKALSTLDTYYTETDRYQHHRRGYSLISSRSLTKAATIAISREFSVRL
jgi:hypothetical protein